MAMGRWVVEATTALACPAGAATTLEGLRSCSIIRVPTSHPRPCCGVDTVYDVSATLAMSGYAHGPRTSLDHV